MTPSVYLPNSFAAAPRSEQMNLFQKVAFSLLLAEMFIGYTRLFDQVAVGFRIPGIVLGLSIPFSVMSGALIRGFESKAGRTMLAFVAWVTVTVPLGLWRSGSLPFYGGIIQSLFFFGLAAGLVFNVRHSQLIMNTLALSILVAAILSRFFGTDAGGRLALAVGEYQDPNEYSMCLLMGIPLWWRIAATSNAKLLKFISLLCTIPIFWVLSRTGSRGGSIGLIAVLLILFIGASIGKKALIIAITVFGLLTTVAYMPDYLKARYQTYFQADAGEPGDLGADAASGRERKDLVIKSIFITMHYPIFGVGPGNFPVAVFEDAKAHGERYPWLVTHNSYTQISSETGIPGLILFVAIIVYAFKSLSLVLTLTGPRSPTPLPDIESTARYFRLSLIGVCVCMMFLSVAYTPLIYILAGIAVGFERVVRHEIARIENAPQQPVRQPFAQSKFAPTPALTGPRPVGFRTPGRALR